MTTNCKTSVPHLTLPLSIVLYSILFLYSRNIHCIYATAIIQPLLVLIITGLSLFVIFYRALGNPLKASLITSQLLVFLLFYGHIQIALMKAGFDFSNSTTHFTYFIVFTTLNLLTIYLVAKTRKNLSPVFTGLFYFILFLNIFPVYKLLSYRITTHPQIQTSITKIKKTLPAGRLIYSIKRPDIFYIIVDGYARNDILNEFYAYDNTPFTTWLINKNFYVADESISNYGTTFMSLASSLNLQYINYLGAYREKYSPNRMLPYHMLRNSDIGAFLKRQGYYIINLATTYTGSEKFASSDYAIDNRNFLSASEFIIMLAHTTILKFFEKSIDSMISKQMLANLEFVNKIPITKRPVFAFVHLLVPHPPFLFDKTGKTRRQPPKVGQFLGAEHWHSKKEYIEQLSFLNSKLKDMIANILEHYKDPVIIIQGDHGTGSSYLHSPYYKKERFSIFNAFYVNKAMRAELYPSLSPVNTFRLLCNTYFKLDLPVLEDKSYLSKITSPFMLQAIGSKH